MANTIVRLEKFDNDRPIWERQTGEPVRWFDRFDRHFRPLGTSRSLRKAYKRWKIEKLDGDYETDDKGNPIVNGSVSNSFWTAYTKYRWPERAEAWDAYVREERIADEARYREDARFERRAILRGMKSKLAVAVTKLNPEAPGWKAVKDFARVVMEQERAEYDELPTQKMEATGAGGGPIQHLDLASLRNLTDEQLEQIIAIAGALEGGSGDGEN